MSDNIINVTINDEPVQIVGEIITSETVIEAVVSSGAKGDPGEKGEKGDPFRFEDFTKEQLDSLGVDKHYVHKQTIASKEWYMYHPLKKFPSVSIVDSAGTEWSGILEYVSDELVVAKFSAEMSGKAFLN